MAKEIMKKIKMQLPGGGATMAPPVGTMLGPVGINSQEFIQKFNDETQDKRGDIVPVEIIVYEDKSFDFIVKTPPASYLIKKAMNLEKGSSAGANEYVGTISQEEVMKIAEIKLVDANAYTKEEVFNSIVGTARNMGVAVKGINEAELKAQTKEAEAEAIELAIREAELEEMEATLGEEVDLTQVETTEQSSEPEDVEEDEE